MLAANIANATADTFINVLQDRQLSQLSQFQDVLTEYGIEQDDSIIAAQAAMLSVLSVVEPAVPASDPYNDDLTRNLGVAAGVSVVLAALGILLIAYLDDRVKSPEDLKKAAGLISLGSIPRYKLRNGLGIASLGDDRRLAVVTESYRLLWTNIDFVSRTKKELKSILVTSSGISDGKTTTATNLAISAANEGKSVILVDSDLRRPALHQVFNLGDHRGLTHLLNGEASLEEVLAPTPVKGLRVLASGVARPEHDIVVTSAEMKRSVEQIKKGADLVIFDSPSLLAVTDAMLLATLVEATLLVVDTRRTDREAVSQAAERLRQVDAYIVGAVLNRVGEKGQTRRYRRYYRLPQDKSRARRHLRLPSLPVLWGLLLGSILMAVSLGLWTAQAY